MTSPALPYIAVPESFKLPPGRNFGGTSGVAFNSKGNIFVIHRGPMPLMEFDPEGNFIRGFGDGMFDRPHGLRIDAQDNIWATDVAMNLVYKFNPSGRLEMVLGVKGRTGDWHPGICGCSTNRTRRWSGHQATSSCFRATARANPAC
jgi:streptogramin lyase